MTTQVIDYSPLDLTPLQESATVQPLGQVTESPLAQGDDVVLETATSWEPLFGVARFSEVEYYFRSAATPTHFSSTVTHSLAQFFVASLPQSTKVERVFCAMEKTTLRVWTVLNEPDFAIEEPIYEAQLRFIDKFPEELCDFSVIYRFGKSIDELRPLGATVVA